MNFFFLGVQRFWSVTILLWFKVIYPKYYKHLLCKYPSLYIESFALENMKKTHDTVAKLEKRSVLP
jgi:hypothetical protein